MTSTTATATGTSNKTAAATTVVAQRVLFVWGSETRVTEGFVNDVIAKQWRKSNSNSNNNSRCIDLEVVNGDKMADRWDEVTPSNYDFLLVATSSYAEGDPPAGFGKFLYRLQEAASQSNSKSKSSSDNTTDSNSSKSKSSNSKSNSSSLYGLQHAVLGVGNTQYDTFQNIPRHVDKYLGECGSRRCKPRFEWDEMENSEADIRQWSDEMRDIILRNNNNDNDNNVNECDKPEVCSWETPESELFQKYVNKDGWEDTTGGHNSSGSGTQFGAAVGPWMMIVGALVVLAGLLLVQQQ